METEPEMKPVSPRLTLYYYPTCPYCVRVLRVLDRLGLELDKKDIIRDSGARRELGAGGGRTTVPCLRIDQQGNTRWMYESADIIRYLETLAEGA